MKKYIIVGVDLLSAFLALELMGFLLFSAVMIPAAVMGSAPPLLLLNLFVLLFAPLRLLTAHPFAALLLLFVFAALLTLHLVGYRSQRTTRHAVAAVGAAISCAVCFLISIELLS